MPRPDPSASDWSDLDLLTVTEAAERLTDELAEVRARIAALSSAAGVHDTTGCGAGSGAEELAACRRREDLLARAIDRVRRPRGIIPGLPSDPAPDK